MTNNRDSSAAGLRDQGIERDDAAKRSLVDDLRQLAGEARGYAEAEATYQKARAGYAGGAIKRIIVYGLLGAVLVFFALMALTVGLILALTPLLTAFGATAAVVLALLLSAFICVKLAASRFGAMTLALGGDKPDGKDRKVDDAR